MNEFLSLIILGSGFAALLTFHHIAITKTRSWIPNILPYPLVVVVFAAGSLKHQELNLVGYALVLVGVGIGHMLILRFR